MDKTKKILICGNHPIITDLRRQYEAADWEVTEESTQPYTANINMFNEVFILSNYSESSSVQADSNSIKSLALLADSYDLSAHEGRKLTCHILFRSQTTYWMFKNIDYNINGVDEKFDIYAFTLESEWATTLLCGFNHSSTIKYPYLDRTPITCDSSTTVHLVIIGWSEMCRSIAIQTALIAHYPNQVRDSHLRTRITIIGTNSKTESQSFRRQYATLFDNSYYRSINLNSTEPTCTFHEPEYIGQRKDFIDIEWEFVQAELENEVVQKKLSLWATDKHQLLTIALCDNDENSNLKESLLLPSEIYAHKIPIFTYVKDKTLVDIARKESKFSEVYPFGMPTAGYDIAQPLTQMAKLVNYYYSSSYNGNTFPIDDVERLWSELSSFSMRYSNVANVMTIPTKMRSLSHQESDWTAFYALTQPEIDQISEVEHNRWCVERLITGFRPCTNEERNEIATNILNYVSASIENRKDIPDLKKEYKSKQKAHYDICAFSELGMDRTGRNVRIYDEVLTASIPLIVKVFNDDYYEK